MPIKYEYYETGDPFSVATVSSEWWHGQTFTPTLAHEITSVKLKGFRSTSAVTGTITVSIKAVDGNDLPTGNDLASGTYDIADLPVGLANRDWFEVSLTPYSLTAGVKYVIVSRGSGEPPTNGFYSQQFGTGYTYPNQWACSSDDAGVTWYELADDDYLFSEWGNPLGFLYSQAHIIG